MGPIYDGTGLNITAMSYLDQLDVGVLACPQLSPDSAEIPLDLDEALDELVAVTAASSPASTARIGASADSP
jgi:hypothetical protein